MIIRLEKIIPDKNQWRYYILSLQPTLFGDWALIREWGRIGDRGGQGATDFFATQAEALTALEALRKTRLKRGYIVRPSQPVLPFWG